MHAKHEMWVWPKPQLTDLCEGQRRHQPFPGGTGRDRFQFQGKVDLKTSFLPPAKSSSATPNTHQHFLPALWLSGFSAKRIQLASEAGHSASTNNSSGPQTQADITVHFRPYLTLYRISLPAPQVTDLFSDASRLASTAPQR